MAKRTRKGNPTSKGQPKRKPRAIKLSQSPRAIAGTMARAFTLEAADDVTVEQRIRNCQPSVIKPGELPFTAPVAVSQVWPEDLRETWWPVQDQGRTGACVGFGVGDGLVRWYLVKTNPREVAPDQPLSVRYFWMAAKEMDEFGDWPTTFLEEEGTSVWAALKTAMTYGCLLEAELPLNGGLFPGSKDMFLSVAAARKISKVHPLELNPNSWATWLRTNGPLAVRMSIDRAFEAARKADPNLDTYRSFPDPWNHGHAVALVGYLQAKDRFIIRNSWGTKWGDDGFAYASREYAQQAFAEVWGIYF